jgi:hypothetical protein
LNSPRTSGARSSLAFLLSVLTLTLAFFASYLCASDPLFRAMMRLSRQADLMSQRYVGDLSPERVFADAWRGMQAAIPFEVELAPDSSDTPQDRRLGDWGLLLASDHEGLSVVAVTDGSLFSGALRPGDRVTSVDSDTVQLVDRLKRYLSSRVGDSLTIEVERDGVTDTISVVVSDPPMKSAVSISMLDSVLYCGISSISDHLSASLNDSLPDQVNSGMRGIILDLRNCADKNVADLESIAEAFGESRHSLPTVILVDESTGRQGAGLARQVIKQDGVSIAGNVSRPLRVVTETIPLRTGEHLYVYRGERNEDYYFLRDTLANDTADSSRNGLGAGSDEITPGITGDPPSLSAITLDLLDRGLMIDYAAASSYRALPAPAEEARMFEEFTAFLGTRGYSYDPLGQAFRDLEISARKPQILPTIRNMRMIINAQPPSRLDDLRSEIIPLLLLHLQEIKIGGEPALADRLRMNDYCLQAALAFLKEPHK